MIDITGEPEDQISPVVLIILVFAVLIEFRYWITYLIALV
jgi:hypothetical protein